ncbi:hypothetical protein [Microbacterium sp. SORGH_AS_0969]|uniref:hypothetical protein n=1 Tax=unclassified Microbacterium TaxID=2609290 RepID=UPI00278977BF|nr:hypothetical protein [Microbacterium sp. SORGH_AS_0969]MDQ1075022.1 hypothetical protein [Microbacterium sp. SORGH_AS_0969]
MPGIRPFDARALVDPVDTAAAKAFTTRLRREGRINEGGRVAAIVVYIVMLVFIGGFALVGLFFLIVFASVLKEGAIFIGILFGLPVLLCVGVIVGAFFFGLRGDRIAQERRWRLARFAHAVSMEYVPSISEPPLPGSIFQRGSGRTAVDVLRGREPRFVEVGNYRYTVSNGKNQTTVRWGYIAIKLNVPLPHIVLDASGNNISLGTFGRDQHLSLEGDFDRYFRLYCPQGYERDALYLFTPDVMARFIDNAAVFDVEIVDDWLFLYSSDDMSTLDPGRWAWTFSLLSALLDKLAQWERWRDDRLLPATDPGVPWGPGAAASPAPGVAAAGLAAAGAGAPGAGAPVSGAPGTAGPGFVAPGGGMPEGVASAPAPVAPLPLSAPPGVAPPGRRLRRGVPWLALGIIGGVLALGFVLIGGTLLLPVLFLR